MSVFKEAIPPTFLLVIDRKIIKRHIEFNERMCYNWNVAFFVKKWGKKPIESVFITSCKASFSALFLGFF